MLLILGLSRPEQPLTTCRLLFFFLTSVLEENELWLETGVRASSIPSCLAAYVYRTYSILSFSMINSSNSFSRAFF